MNDPEHKLQAWADDPVEAPDASFADRLEASLRVQFAERAPAAGGAGRPLWQPVALAAVALVALASLGVVLLGRADDGLVVAAATDTQIVLPGGDIVAGTEGLELPDGTQILVGPEGSMSIADVVLAPGTVAEVVDGAVEIIDAPPAPAPPSPSGPPPTAPSSPEPSTSTTTDTTAPVSRPSTTGPSSPSTSLSDRPSTSSTTVPTTRASTTTVSSTATPPSTTTTTTTENAAPTVSLVATPRPTVVELAWSFAGPDTVAAWEIIVTSGERASRLVLLRDAGARGQTVERLAVPVAYRVVALDAAGSVVAQSLDVPVS